MLEGGGGEGQEPAAGPGQCLLEKLGGAPLRTRERVRYVCQVLYHLVSSALGAVETVLGDAAGAPVEAQRVRCTLGVAACTRDAISWDFHHLWTLSSHFGESLCQVDVLISFYR